LSYSLKGTLNLNEIGNLAVFAVYPGTTPLQSVERMIDVLKSHSYQILIVINRNRLSDLWNDSLSKKNCLILSRNNIGSDFGAYKAGIYYLRKKGIYKKIKHLVLVNDSIYLTDKSKQIISQIVSPESPINTLLLHRQSIAHASATILKLDNTILNKKQFISFWKKYYPYSLKNQMIRKGEHALTEACGLDYFKPWVNYDQLELEQRLPQMLATESSQMLNWARRSLGSHHENFENFVTHAPLNKVIDFCIFSFQVSNALGLYLARNFEVPIKLDLVKLGLIVKSDYMDLLREKSINPDEIKEVQEIIERKGSYTTNSYLSRLLNS